MILRGPHRPDLLRKECLPDILSATARRRPEHIAIIFGPRSITYRELDSLSRRVSAALARRGAAAGRIIGLYLPRGADALVAQAGISGSAAVWLPFDSEAPLERVEACLHAAGALGLVTCRKWLDRLKGLPVPAWAVEDLLAEVPEPPGTTPPGPRPDDPAYVIFTSGSTGQPKGIAISHRSICHLLRSENVMLDVREDDLVYQGFSLAFDMSFEEIWISYLAGATLWVAPDSLVHDPEQISQALAGQKITVLHAVPTLVGMMDPPPPNVRLLNLGGEACPESLAARLARPGLRLLNSYGPTEITVTASLAELSTGAPVTIGTPLPNYGMMVTGSDRRALPPGEAGELCVFGPGLAIGYLNRPDLTGQKFVPNPEARSPDEARMYLTGDLGRIDAAGRMQCLGRVDNQVKVRGFRVELEEIEAALSAQPGVAAAAVALRGLGGIEQLVAFIAPASGGRPEPAELRRALASRLPGYMVPARFELLADLPRLASGKVDRQALKSLPLPPAPAAADDSPAPADEHMAALFNAVKSVLPGAEVRAEADFFDDLGGHSLLAARLVSTLRRDARYATMSVQDVYRERRLEAIAASMNRIAGRARASVPERKLVPRLRRFLCGLAQAAVIPFLVLLHIVEWLAPFFTYHFFTGDADQSMALATAASVAVFVLAQVATLVIAVAGKWLIAGRIRAGRYPLWGFTYFRYWLADKLGELPPAYLMNGTPWMPLYLRAMGAKIGRDVAIDSLNVSSADQLVIDAGATVGATVNIANMHVAGGELIVGPVHIGREAVVESYAVLENDTALGAGSRLCGLSALSAGRSVPAGETWEGAPARAVSRPVEPLPPRQKPGRVFRALRAAGFALATVLVAVFFFMPIFPSFMLIDWMDAHLLDIFESDYHPLLAFAIFFLLAIPASLLLVTATACLAAVLRNLLPRQRSGVSSIYGFAYFRKWLVSRVLESSLGVLHGLYASIFAGTWLRAMGASVGRGTEVSTATGMVPDLLTLGEQSFIADGVMLGDEENRGGWIVLKPTTIGGRSFVGNGAYVSDGAAVPPDVLIGVQTRTPENAALAPGQTWMGSPALLLPAREHLAGFDERLTFRPSWLRRLGRGTVEALRIVLPLAFIIASGYLIILLTMPLAEDEEWLALAGTLAAAGCLYGFASYLFVLALKWALVGRYRPRAAPMWTPFVWLSEAVTNLYESLAVPNWLTFLCGTPMLPWSLRLLGAKVGRGTFIDTTDLTEFDCVHIGDDSELNSWCGPQTHLFEDRVMKIGLVEIGSRVTVGASSTILYDTQVADDVRLGPLTLVAKGERLPPATAWEGSPARPAGEAAS